MLIMVSILKTQEQFFHICGDSNSNSIPRTDDQTLHLEVEVSLKKVCKCCWQFEFGKLNLNLVWVYFTL